MCIEGRLLDEVDAWLVVLVLDLDPADALLGVDLLLHLEDELEEELVQLLVGEVDAQLLERVVSRGREQRSAKEGMHTRE